MKYTILDFRQNLREAFDKALAGEDVEIKRYDQVFRLVPEGKYEARKEDLEVMGGMIQTGQKLKSQVEDMAGQVTEPIQPVILKDNEQVKGFVKSLPKKSTIEYCQHGNVKGLCKKGCK